MFHTYRVAVFLGASLGFSVQLAGAAPQTVMLTGPTNTVADTFVTNGPSNKLGGGNYGGAGA